MRLPFLPTRCGLATDVVRLNPELKTIQSPHADGETCWRCRPSAGRGDPAQSSPTARQHLGHRPDPYFDHLRAGGGRRYVSVTSGRGAFELDAAEARFNTFERYRWRRSWSPAAPTRPPAPPTTAGT